MRRRRVFFLLVFATSAALVTRCATVGQFSEWHERDVARKLGELESFVAEAVEEAPAMDAEAVAARLDAELGLEAEVVFEADEADFGEALAWVDPAGDEGAFALVSVPGTPDALRLGPSDDLVTPVGFFELLALVPATLAAWLVVLSLTGSYRRRLRAISRTAQRLKQGEWLARVDAEDEGPDPVGRLAAALNGVGEQLQRFFQGQKELLQAVSHELRTPPSRIRFRLELLEGAGTEEERRRHISGIDRDAARLDELVDELLLFVRFDQGQGLGAREAIPLSTLLADVGREARAVYPDTAYDWEGPDDAGIHGSPRHVRRALENLVLNACRHARGRVRVRCALLAGGQVEVAVEDDGPGVPADQRERIFEPFARGDTHRGESSGGVGLGLAIVQRILEAHEGSVEVGASDLGGARFVTRWPATDTKRDTIDMV